MQVSIHNGVVNRKPQINISVPPTFRQAWDEYANPFGVRRGSTVGMAALASFLAMPRKEQARWISLASSAEALGNCEELLGRRASDKPLRIAAKKRE